MSTNHPDDLARYDRQMRYAPLGEAGQRRLAAGRALVCGCGALGSVIANTLVRAGVGFVRIVDRDFLEMNNLQRQVLFDEQDVADGLPKAIAAARRLQRINSAVTIEPVVVDVTHTNLGQLANDVDVIVDGTDNFSIRFLLNDFAVKNDTPWVYGGTIGAEGQTMTILPGETACLACVISDAPPPGSTPTCETAGILGSAVGVIASIEALEAIKILSGHRDAISRHLTVIDLWENSLRRVDLSRLRSENDCRVCGQGEFDWLSGKRGNAPTVLCGRNAVQIGPSASGTISLEQLATRLEKVGPIVCNEFLLRLHVDSQVLTIFPDGRTIVAGTDDLALARSLHAKYVGG